MKFNNIRILLTSMLLVVVMFLPQLSWAQIPMEPEGSGSKEDPYIIRTAENLAWFRDEVNDGSNTSACAKIADDVEVIDLKNFCHAEDTSQSLDELSWVPIGNSNNMFLGIFDGNGKTITNLYINASQNYMGLFGYTDQSTIKNLTFENANVTNTESFTGILVGRVLIGSTFQNIKISETCQMKGGRDYTGGIAGSHDGNAYNCVNYASVQGKEDVGGLFGCYARTGDSMTACANYGNVTATSQIAGGLVGYFSGGTIQDCANYGNVKSPTYVAGMAGFVHEGKIQNVFCYGSISATDDTQDVGMAFGYSNKGTTEGIVAYYSGAKLTINGQEITVKAFGNGNLSEDKATGFTEAQLKSGEVAYLLNGRKSEGKLAWYQKLGDNGDQYPILQSSGNDIVYYGKYCTNEEFYTNDNSLFDDNVYPHKRYKIATTPDSQTGLYSYVCSNCKSVNQRIKFVKDFCGIAGNNLKLTCNKGKYNAEAVTLTDGEAYNSPVDIEVADFRYARTYAANQWQPLYVPFAMNVDQWTSKGLTVASINNFHEVKLKSGDTQVLLEVKKVTSGSLEPNIPYLIMCDAEGENLLELGTTTLSKAEEGFIDCHSVTRNYVFQGKYATKSGFDVSQQTAIYYGVKDGEMVQLTAEDKIGPQNWYLTVTNRPNLYDVDRPLTSAARTFSIRVIGDGEATGIEDIHVISDEGESGKQGIFDLQGRQLNSEPTHGIYIKNGKKYVK